MHSTSIEDDIRILALVTTPNSAFDFMMLDLIEQVIYVSKVWGHLLYFFYIPSSECCDFKHDLSDQNYLPKKVTQELILDIITTL